MRSADDNELATLRLRAEDAIARGKAPSQLRALLERIVKRAAPASDDATFANRHLAELLVEENPWKAAVHLRRLSRWHQADDVVEALLGLCHALLGNFHCAVSAYQRALRISSRSPWYHHNLGHLLDVALGQPRRALHHLRLAHRLEPEEHEITASLAHCLARAGAPEEAEQLALEAMELDPEHQGHRALVSWIRSGAPEKAGPRRVSGALGSAHASLYGVHHAPTPLHASMSEPSEYDGSQTAAAGGRASEGVDASVAAPLAASLGHEHPQTPVAQDVELALERTMKTAGFSSDALRSARALWADYRDGRRIRVQKPESYAAAVEYAIACVQGLNGVTQTAVARRYGIHRHTLANRYLEIREALDLEPGDPRYARRQSDS